MKTTFILFIIGFFFNTTIAQTIAVAEFNTSGLHVTPEIAAKIARLELIKINKYVVMDEADMSEHVLEEELTNCYGKKCLVELGKKLNVPYIMSGSIDGFGNKIVVSIKLIDIENSTVKSTLSREFNNMEDELQRMIGIVIQEIHDIQPPEEITKRLAFNNEIIISDNVGKLNNAGPRMGIAFIHDSELSDFFTRKESQGGLGIRPIMTNLGYQFEGQYIGTENFSALGELIFNVGGMEQGQFIPSVSLLNGFRIGQHGWEFAFGPSFGLKRISKGYFDENGNYLRASDVNKAHALAYENNPDLWSEPYQKLDQSIFSDHLDKQGVTKITTNWLMGFGRTFKAGALNIPVNIYYSSNKYGGMIGASVGFNVTNSKQSIH